MAPVSHLHRHPARAPQGRAGPSTVRRLLIFISYHGVSRDHQVDIPVAWALMLYTGSVLLSALAKYLEPRSKKRRDRSLS